MKVSESITDKVQSTIPIGLQIQGAHLYDKTRRWVTGTNGKKIFVESPIPPVEDVELADIDLSNPFLYRQGRWLRRDANPAAELSESRPFRCGGRVRPRGSRKMT